MTPSSLGTIAAMFTTSCEPSTLLSRRGLRVSALGWGSAAMGPAGTAAAAGGGYGRGREGGGPHCRGGGGTCRSRALPGQQEQRGAGGTAPERGGQGWAGPGGARCSEGREMAAARRHLAEWGCRAAPWPRETCGVAEV